MMKFFSFKKFFLILLLCINLCGCLSYKNFPSSLAFDGFFPVTRFYISPIRSVEYYKNKYSINVYEKYHSMKDEKISKKRAKKVSYKINKSISYGGKIDKDLDSRINSTKYLSKSNRIKNNDYILILDKIHYIEKQIDDDSCWAACVKYLLYFEKNKNISQKDIINYLKKNKQSTLDANVFEILRGLAIKDVWMGASDAKHIMVSLGEGHPVMMGIINNRGLGHAVIVVGVRFSFIDPLFPYFNAQSGFAFEAFEILDPADGDLHIVKASEYEDHIGFIMSFF